MSGLEGPAGAAVLALARKATRLTSPSGDGDMVWYRWGQGTPLVLMHGGSGSWPHWIRNIEALSAHYSVMAPDLPGLGESALPSGGALDAVVATLANGIGTVLPAGERFHLVGFSSGGALSCGLAAQCGPRLLSFTLVGAGPGRRPPQLGLHRVTPGMTAQDIAAVQRKNLSLLMLHDPAAIDELAVLLQTRSTRLARLKTVGLFPPGWIEQQIAQIHAPVAAIWGEFDATSHPYLDERKQALRALHPDAPFHVVAGAGHWVQYEAAEAFNALLLDHLASVRPDR